MEVMLEKMRTINWLLQKTAEGYTPFGEWCEVFNSMTDSDVYIINRFGEILGAYCENAIEDSDASDSEAANFISDEVKVALAIVEATLVNISLEESVKKYSSEKINYKDRTMIIPIFGGGRREGTLILSRDCDYNTEDIIVGECGAAVLGIDIERRQNRSIEAELRKRAVVQIALGTLSLTEIEAVKQIFEEMDADEGLVVADKIDRKTGIKKAVILNGLKKLEIAGVIESKTLGMKGTHIKIVNNQLKAELERI